MKRFYITRISATGAKVQPSSVEFEKGVNIIHGPSNTGKSYIIGCLNFMFCGEEIPFTKAATGYDTVSMQMENDEGDRIQCTRKIVDGKKGETGAGKVTVASTLADYPSQDYGIANGEYSDFLLALFGIKEKHSIIATQEFKPNRLTVRTFFNFFFLDEEHIFKRETVLFSSSYKRVTASIMSLLFLLNGNDYNDNIPEESAEDKERRAIQKAGIILYLNKKIQELTKRRNEIQQSDESIVDVDVEDKIDALVREIESVEESIIAASEESQQLLEQIYDISGKLEEARFLRNRYRVLRSQYASDIRRLRFIADGDAKGGKVHQLVKCPFCDSDIHEQQGKRVSYIEASKAELEKVTLQLQDLEEASKDLDNEILVLEKQITTLNCRNDQVTRLIGSQLKPKAAELKSMVAVYKHVLQTQQQIYALDTMSKELNADVSEREMDDEEDSFDFNPKELLKREGWEKLSICFGDMVKACNYPGNPVARISIDTLDAVVNGKHKKDEGKGYRAFLNTIMLFNLMKFLEQHGTYAPRFLFLDSPILSLKEKKHKIKENEKATSGMRESLFRYIIDFCGDNQVIIAENELPENVDYSNAKLIEFTMDETVGRYGFLMSERNIENE